MKNKNCLKGIDANKLTAIPEVKPPNKRYMIKEAGTITWDGITEAEYKMSNTPELIATRKEAIKNGGIITQ